MLPFLIPAFELLYVCREVTVDEADVGGVEPEPGSHPALVPKLAHNAGSNCVHRHVAYLLKVFIPEDKKKCLCQSSMV